MGYLEGLIYGLKNAKSIGIQQGIEQGIEQGIKKGEKKALLETARAMLKDGLSIDVIKKFTRLSNDDLDNLKQDL